MLGTTRPTTPVTVRVDRARSTDAAGGALTGLLRTLGAVLVAAVTAPALTTLAVVVAGVVGLALTGHPFQALAAVVVLGLLTASAWWARPSLVLAARAVVVGQALRALVYRPRWDTACLAAGAIAKVGTTVHLPGLVRHTHTSTGADVLLVHMAPGQTLSTWRDAAESLASTFSAHSITPRTAGRPGWVVLDVLRRDPLATERVAPDPARAHRAVVAPQITPTPTRGPGRVLNRLNTIPGLAGHPALAATKPRPCVPPGAVVLGRDEYGNDVIFDPYATAHAGMQGATRSGKSSACYTLLAALAYRADVIVCGVDPTGLLLDPFTTENNGRGGAFIATGTSRDDITRAGTILADLVALMDARIRDLHATKADKLTEFTPALPAVWVVMEEFPGLLAAAKALDAEAGAKPGDRLAPRLAAALGRLVKEGAKVGVFVLVLAQRMSADALNTDDRMNLALRLTLRVDNGDAVAMLHDGIGRDHVTAVRGFAPGVALLETPGDGVRRIRLHYTDYTTYRARVAAGITATAPAPTISTDGTPTVDLVGKVITLPTNPDNSADTCEEDAA